MSDETSQMEPANGKLSNHGTVKPVLEVSKSVLKSSRKADRLIEGYK